MKKSPQNNQSSLLISGKETASFKEILNSNHPYFHPAMEIYKEAFPPNERHPKKVIEDRLNAGKSRMFVGVARSKVILVCLLFNLSEREFILLDYMAIADKFRGKGTGSEFMKFLSKFLRRSGKYLVMEVENPEFGANKEQRKKRIKFYKNNGAKIMKGVLYILPALDNKIPTEMNLMLLPEYNQPSIKKSIVRDLILKIYKEVYNRDADDPLLNSFIDTIPKSVTLI